MDNIILSKNKKDIDIRVTFSPKTDPGKMLVF